MNPNNVYGNLDEPSHHNERMLNATMNDVNKWETQANDIHREWVFPSQPFFSGQRNHANEQGGYHAFSELQKGSQNLDRNHESLQCMYFPKNDQNMRPPGLQTEQLVLLPNGRYVTERVANEMFRSMATEGYGSTPPKQPWMEELRHGTQGLQHPGFAMGPPSHQWQGPSETNVSLQRPPQIDLMAQARLNVLANQQLHSMHQQTQQLQMNQQAQLRRQAHMKLLEQEKLRMMQQAQIKMIQQEQERIKMIRQEQERMKMIQQEQGRMKMMHQQAQMKLLHQQAQKTTKHPLSVNDMQRFTKQTIDDQRKGESYMQRQFIENGNNFHSRKRNVDFAQNNSSNWIQHASYEQPANKHIDSHQTVSNNVLVSNSENEIYHHKGMSIIHDLSEYNQKLSEPDRKRRKVSSPIQKPKTTKPKKTTLKQKKKTAPKPKKATKTKKATKPKNITPKPATSSSPSIPSSAMSGSKDPSFPSYRQQNVNKPSELTRGTNSFMQSSDWPLNFDNSLSTRKNINERDSNISSHESLDKKRLPFESQVKEHKSDSVFPKAINQTINLASKEGDQNTVNVRNESLSHVHNKYAANQPQVPTDVFSQGQLLASNGETSMIQKNILGGQSSSQSVNTQKLLPKTTPAQFSASLNDSLDSEKKKHRRRFVHDEELILKQPRKLTEAKQLDGEDKQNFVHFYQPPKDQLLNVIRNNCNRMQGNTLYDKQQREITLEPKELESEFLEDINPLTTVQNFEDEPVEEHVIERGVMEVEIDHLDKIRNHKDKEYRASFPDVDPKCKLKQFTEEQIRNSLPKKTNRKIIDKFMKGTYINCDVRYFNLGSLDKFQVVMLDPPWRVSSSQPSEKSSMFSNSSFTLNYNTLSNSEIMDLNIETLSDEGFLFLWTLNSTMQFALSCMNKWGYQYIDKITWVKTSKNNPSAIFISQGYYILHSTETCLIGIKRKKHSTFQYISKAINDVIISNVKQQSEKPSVIYKMIESLLPGARKIEIFARNGNIKKGWLSLGNRLGPSFSNGYPRKYKCKECDTWIERGIPIYKPKDIPIQYCCGNCFKKKKFDIKDFFKFENVLDDVVYHDWYTCDECHQFPLSGPRFSCGCDGYDVCEDCYDDLEKRKCHQQKCKSKDFQVFEVPPLGNGFPVHHRIKCDSCSSNPIIGERFHCLECDVNLCRNCFFDQKEPKHHRSNHEIDLIPDAKYTWGTFSCHHCKYNIRKSEEVRKIYKCQTCVEYCLCENCYAIHDEVVQPNKAHKIHHQFDLIY